MRHHHTNRSAARAARVLAAALAAALFSHCTEPTRAHGPEGHWILVAVDGSPLPAAISPDETMDSGDMDLIGDGTYVKRATASVTGVEFHASTTGEWSVDGARVELRPSNGSVQIGHWDDGAIEIQTQTGQTFRYVPAAAALTTPRSTTPRAPQGGTPGERRPHYSVSSTAEFARPRFVMLAFDASSRTSSRRRDVAAIIIGPRSPTLWPLRMKDRPAAPTSLQEFAARR